MGCFRMGLAWVFFLMGGSISLAAVKTDKCDRWLDERGNLAKTFYNGGLLKDSPSERAKEVREIIRCRKGTAVVTAIFKMTHSPKPLIRERASLALGSFVRVIARMGREALPFLSSMLSSPSKSLRSTALSVLDGLDVKAEEVIPLFLRALQDKDLQERAGAALVERPREALPHLFSLLVHPNQRLREIAILGLLRLRQRDGGEPPPLQKDIQRRAEEIRPLLKRSLQNCKGLRCTDIALFLVDLGSFDVAWPTLEKALQTPRAFFRESILRALREIPQAKKKILARAKSLCLDPQERVRFESFRVIFSSGISKKEHALFLAKAAQDRAPRIRRFALKMRLEGMGCEATQSILQEALREQSMHVAGFAMKRLEKQGRESIPFLVKQLLAPEVLVRRRVAQVLLLLGGLAFDAIPALTGALSDQDAQVRIIAAKALSRMGQRKVARSTLQKAGMND